MSLRRETKVLHDGKHNSFSFGTSLKENQLRRLILIDGFDIMHHFKEMSLDESKKMCPLIIIPFACKLMQEGFVVRIILKCFPEESEISDSYGLYALESAGLCIFPLNRDAKKSDLLMLQMAKRYGAVIITRREFVEYKDHQETSEKYVVQYDKIPTGHLIDRSSSEILETQLVFKFSMCLNESAEKFIVEPLSEDYELVQRACKEFKQIDEDACTKMTVVTMYIFARFCYVFNREVPEVCKHFIGKNAFPMLYQDFYDAYVEYKNEGVEEGGVLEEEEFVANGLGIGDICLEDGV